MHVRKETTSTLFYFDLFDLQKQKEERSLRRKILFVNLEAETKGSMEV